MRLPSKLFPALLALLVFASLAFAADVKVEHLAVYDSIIEGERAAFDVRVTNNEDVRDTFRFSTNDLLWDLTSDPLYHYFSGVDINPGESKTVRLILAPADKLELGQYRVDVKVRGEKSGEVAEIPLFVTVRPARPLIREYLAAVHKIVEVPAVVDPREPVSVKVNLVNRNPKDLDEVKVVFSSNLISREVSTSLGPLENKVVEETFELNPFTVPQNDTLKVELVVDDNVLEPTIVESYEVGAYSDIVIDSESVEKSFLKSITATAYRNNGNVRGSAVVEVPTNPFKTYFTKSSPEYFLIKREEGGFLAWELSLEPGASATITRTVSYRPLMVVLLILAAAVALYYFLRSPVAVVKRANVTNLKDTGISEMKIFVHLRNRTDRMYERVTITDTIPVLARVTEGSDVGTLKPDSVYNDGSKTIVKWELKHFEPGEERILSYSMHAKLAILGSLTLPPTVMRFYSKKGSKLVTRSDAVKVKV